MHRGFLFWGDRRAVAVIEFALLLPPLLLLLLGIFGYGQYFLLAHSVQQIANDAARATIGGLSTGERWTRATNSVDASVAQLPDIRVNKYALAVTENGNLVTVTVTVDATANPLLASRFVPMPEAVIRRQGVVRQGGIE